MGKFHRDIVGSDLHRFAVWSDVDPATTYGTDPEEGGVHPGLAWLEHSTGAPDTIVSLKVRNEANDGWVDFGALFTPPMGVNEETGAYELTLADAEGTVRVTNAGAVALTVPDNATIPFPIGTSILVIQGGVGQVTLTPAGGVTLNSAGAKLKLTSQYSAAALVKMAADEWVVSGDLSA
jgi:hypothetical protein